MCEEKQSAEMLRLDGGFWDGGLEVVEKGASTTEDAEGGPGEYDEGAEEAEWEREAVEALESLGSVSVLDG